MPLASSKRFEVVAPLFLLGFVLAVYVSLAVVAQQNTAGSPETQFGWFLSATLSARTSRWVSAAGRLPVV